jgi:hypothetical protein
MRQHERGSITLDLKYQIGEGIRTRKKTQQTPRRSSERLVTGVRLPSPPSRW